MKIFITGHTGFIGKYFISKNTNYIFFKFDKKNVVNDVDVFLHFAGRAHDLENINSLDKYLEDNTDLTKKIFDQFLLSKAKKFIFLSSVKACTDKVKTVLTETDISFPTSPYGISKRYAEDYILDKIKSNPEKKVYILRPCMVHGPGNKGNLNLMYKFIMKYRFWPFGGFNNKRNYCGIDTLCFVINQLIGFNNINSGIYNVTDDDPISTNDLVRLIAKMKNRNIVIIPIPKFLVYYICKFGDIFNLSFNTHRLSKLTENFIVSNKKIKSVIGSDFHYSSVDNFNKTFNSF